MVPMIRDDPNEGIPGPKKAKTMASGGRQPPVGGRAARRQPAGESEAALALQPREGRHGLVSPARKLALNSSGMFCEPLTHLVIGPGPFKGMGVPMVVFGPGSRRMGLELFPALPRRPFQVIMLKRMDEDLRLVQPRRIGRRIPRFPPATGFGEIASRAGGYVARPAVLDQEDAA